MRFHALILSVLFCALTAGAAETILFTVNLSGGNVVPPDSISLSATGLVTLTDSALAFHLGLQEAARVRPVEVHHGTSQPPVVVLASWHLAVNGPAPAGSNAPALFDLGICGAPSSGFSVASVVIIAITKPQNGPRTPIPPPVPPAPGIRRVCELEDVITISDAEKRALLAGLLYVEADGFGGRIRGQIIPVDSDADGVPDYLDQCQGTLPDMLVNRDGCSLDQLVPCDGPWKNHGQFEKAFKDATKSFVEDGFITKQTKHELDKEAAHSDCGKQR